MRIKTQLTKSLLPKLALNLGAFIKLERAHGWLCNWESLGSKPPGISAGSLGSGCVLLSGTLAVNCKAQQGDELEGRPRHPQRHTEACEAPPCLQGPLVPDTGWLPNKELSSSPFFQTPPLFFKKKIIKNICIGQSGHMLGQRQKNRRLWVGLQVCKALSSQPGSLPELLQEAPCLWRLSFLTC